MRGGLFVGEPIMEGFCAVVVRYVLHGAECQNADLIDLRPAPGDCLFDAGFGFGCSDKQKQHVADAEKAGAANPY